MFSIYSPCFAVIGVEGQFVLKKVSFFSFVFIFLQKNKTKEKKTSDYPNKEHLQASSNKIPGSSWKRRKRLFFFKFSSALAIRVKTLRLRGLNCIWSDLPLFALLYEPGLPQWLALFISHKLCTICIKQPLCKTNFLAKQGFCLLFSLLSEKTARIL